MKPSLPAHSPLLLIILDGWGYREDTQYNAITTARTSFWDQLWRDYPHTLLVASGLAVGLPKGQMGNSEVGHLHMGAGRQVLQDLTRIDLAIESGKFDHNAVLTRTIDALIQNNKSLHVCGLLSPGGVHSHELHIQAMIKLAAKRGLKNIYLHAFLDGRDTPPKSAKNSLLMMEQIYQTVSCGQTASLIGRYYAMDRDKRWERIVLAYDLLTQGKAAFHATHAVTALEEAYTRGETDEFVQPTAIHAENKSPITLQNGDAMIFMNFRADRARQLAHALTDSEFNGFHRDVKPRLSRFVTLTKYADDISAKVAYPPIALRNNLGECVAKMGYKQLRAAETEKYAHVTFFFNGGEEKACAGEERLLVPSPKIATYDLQPEMSAHLLAEELILKIRQRKHALIVCNFANPDMVGHTGNLNATVRAIQTIDHCLSRVIPVLKTVGGEALITSDHGNAECMFDPKTGQPHTAHTTNLVPVIYVGRHATATTQEGVLYDIAPTVLELMGIEKPADMTGKALFKVV